MGVFYGAAGAEAPAMAGEEVYVVGGANSAGQVAGAAGEGAVAVGSVARPSASAPTDDCTWTPGSRRVLVQGGKLRAQSIWREQLDPGAKIEVQQHRDKRRERPHQDLADDL
jgi:hypothetical protein